MKPRTWMVLFVVFRAEIVMTEDEIGDVGKRGVNQKSHCVESCYRLVALLWGGCRLTSH